MNERTKKRLLYLAVYTAIFAALSLVIFSEFIGLKRTLIGDTDGYRQHIKALTYYSRWLKTIIKEILFNHRFVLPTYTFGLGNGADIVTTLSYYVIGDPFAALAAFLPERFIVGYYSVSIILRFYCAGLSFAAFCRYRMKEPRAVMAASFLYVFCGYGLHAGVMHPYFLNPMIYLPWLLLGIDRYRRERRPVLFVLAVFISAVSNFYFFYMLVIFVILYYVAVALPVGRRVPSADGGSRGVVPPAGGPSWKSFFSEMGQLLILGIIGTAMAGILLYPVFLASVGDSRMTIHYEIGLLYPLSSLRNLFRNFITGETPQSWTYLGYGSIALLSVFLLFVKRRGRTRLKVMFAVLTAFLIFPVVGHVLNTFSYPTNRWVWVYSLLVCYIVVEMWPQWRELTRRELLTVGALLAVYLLLCMFPRYTFTNKSLPAVIIVIASYAAISALLSDGGERRGSAEPAADAAASPAVPPHGLASAAAEAASQPSARAQQPAAEAVVQRSARRKRTFDIALFVCVVSGVIAGGIVTYSWHFSGEVLRTVTTAKMDAEFLGENTEAWDALELGGRDEFYRISGTDASQNTALLAGASANQYYWTLSSPETDKLRNDLGVTDVSNYAHVYNGLDCRSVLEELSSVKYFITKEPYKRPYGYTGEIFRRGGYAIYENTNPLPLGYTYETYFSDDAYEAMTPLEKQESMLRSAYVERAEGLAISEKIPETAVTPQAYEIVAEDEYVTVQDNAFVLTDDNHQVTFTFEAVPQSETYLCIYGLHYKGTREIDLYNDDETIDPDNLFTAEKWDSISTLNQAKMRYSAADWTEENQLLMHSNFYVDDLQFLRKLWYLYTPSYPWYGEKHDFLLNSGYSRSGITSITLELPKIGIYSFDRIEVVSCPMEGYNDAVDALKENVLENVSIGAEPPAYATSEVTGTIALDKEKLLCISIPWSKGWTAYVDGEEQELFHVNIMYMGMVLDAGTHEIRLVYRTPGMRAGLVITLVGIAAFVVMLIFGLFTNRKMC